MKLITTLSLLSLLFISTACKDNVSSDNIIERNTNAGTQDPGDTQNRDISPYPFDGVQNIDEVQQTTSKLHWNLTDKAASYHVFLIIDKKLEHQISLNHPKNNIVLKNLVANTEYEVLIRMMDHQGRLDNNQVTMKFTTSNWPPFTNTKSVKFNGSQGLSLGASNSLINNDRYTLSLWFKTDSKQTDKRLINFHALSSAQTAVNLKLDDGKIAADYQDAFGIIKTISTDFAYEDNQWHFLTISYNGKWHTLYIDGKREVSIEDTFIGFGSHAASIGSYSGMQKGFTGYIDEVSVWNSAIGKTDIEELYHNGSPFDLKQHRRIGVLQAWYRMGDNSGDTGTTIKDNHGDFDGSSNSLNSSSIKNEAP